MKEHEELLLIRDILHGKPDLYAKIIEKYNSRLYGYILKLVHDKQIATELTHDAFVKAYRNLDRFDPSRDFSIWLFTIGRNMVMDHFRYTARHSTYELLEEADFIEEETLLLNPELILEHKEALKQINDAIQLLPQKYRDIVILRYFEDLSYKDIAARLGMSSEKVKWSLHQARKRMSKSIENKHKQESRCEVYGV